LSRTRVTTRLRPVCFASYRAASAAASKASASTLVSARALVPPTLTVTTGYESKADAEWLRVTTLRWIDELRRLNASR